MLRGAIETVENEQVIGWIYSPDVLVKGRTILAFLDDACIGAGKVDVYRRDLEEAGLGDGYCGFVFQVMTASAAEACRVIVKLDGSDAWLPRQGARIADTRSLELNQTTADQLNHDLQSYEWMMSRNWINQDEHEFLRTFAEFGYFNSRVPQQGQIDLVGMDRAVTHAADLLSLLALNKVRPHAVELDSRAAFEALLTERMKQQRRSRVLGLWCSKRQTLAIAEASHQAGGFEASYPSAAFVRVAMEADRLLILDPRCTVRLDAFKPGEVFAFTAL